MIPCLKQPEDSGNNAELSLAFPSLPRLDSSGQTPAGDRGRLDTVTASGHSGASSLSSFWGRTQQTLALQGALMMDEREGPAAGLSHCSEGRFPDSSSGATPWDKPQQPSP